MGFILWARVITFFFFFPSLLMFALYLHTSRERGATSRHLIYLLKMKPPETLLKPIKSTVQYKIHFLNIYSRHLQIHWNIYLKNIFDKFYRLRKTTYLWPVCSFISIMKCLFRLKRVYRKVRPFFLFSLTEPLSPLRGVVTLLNSNKALKRW